MAGLSVTSAPGASLAVRSLPSTLVARRLVVRRTPLLWPIRLHARELLPLLGLPLGDVRVPGLERQRVRRFPVAPVVPRRGRVLGDALAGHPRPVAQAVADAPMHLLVQGNTGSGKSTLLANLVLQDVHVPGRPVVVIEPKGDLIRSLLARIPAHRHNEVVLLDPAAPFTVGLNPLAGRSGDGELAVDAVFSVLKQLNAGSWGPRLGDLLHAGLLTLAHQPEKEVTLVELPALFTDPALRRRLLARLGEEVWTIKPVWAWYDGLSHGEQAMVAGPLLNKLRPWVQRTAVRHLLGVPEPRWSFEDVLGRGRILLVSLGAGMLGRETASLLGALIVDGLWRAITARGSLAPEHRRLALVYIDEWQDYVRLPVDLADALAMSRGYHVGLTLANQSITSQVPADLRIAALSQARSKVVFAVGSADAGVLARELGEPVRPEDLQGLGTYEAVAGLLVGGELAPPVSLRTRPLPPLQQAAEQVTEISRTRYGLDRQEVEAAIRARLAPEPPTGDLGRRRRS